jgi:hypothetical protein
MGLLDRFMGRENESESQRQTSEQEAAGGESTSLSDEQAVARYRYMLQTAPPETIEQAHEEAFAKLTPEQRRIVLGQLTAMLPKHEQAAGAQSQPDPKTLAQMATRAELRQPGILQRTFGGMGGMSIGGLMAGSLLSSIAGGFIGSMIAQQFFDEHSVSSDGPGHELSQELGSTELTQDTAANAGGDLEDAGHDLGGNDDLGDADFGGDDFGDI